MMDIRKFVKENSVLTAKPAIDVSLLEKAESILDFKFGDEMTEYLLRYGFLSFRHVEFYGLNSRQGVESDLVKQTVYLHEYFPATSDYVAIENQGEGDYYLVDRNDRIVNYDTEVGRIVDTGKSLFEYLLDRFEYAK